MIDDEAFEELVDACRERYKSLRRILFGHTRYNARQRWDNCFVKLARLMQENKWGMDFIDAQFDHAQVVPMPNQLYGERAIQRYNASKAGKVKASDECNIVDEDGRGSASLERQRRFQSETLYITTRLKLGIPLEDILRHRGSPLSALTRYCVAYCNGLYDVANAFRAMAVAQLSLHDDYYDIYGTLIPEALRESK
jgi:hypothetical protein